MTLEPITVAFDLYADRLPTHPNHVYLDFLRTVQHHAIDSAPSTVSCLVAAPARRWDQRSSWIEMFALGSFRSAGRVTWQLAQFLAPFYLDAGVLPIVSPIAKSSLDRLGDTRARLRVSKIGMLAFSRERHHGS